MIPKKKPENMNIIQNHNQGIMMMFWWIVIGLIVVAAVFLPLSNWLGKNQRTGDSPIQILEKRYAKGEISKEEFEEQKNNLKRK